MEECKPMDIFDVIRERRSVRCFLPDPVDRARLERVVEAAGWAPSGYNSQPWRFIVVSGDVRDRVIDVIGRNRSAWVARVRDKFSPAMTRRMDTFFSTMGDAPAMVFVYADRDRSGEVNPTDYASACAATQNLLLAAHAEGLGACWLQACCEIEEELSPILGVTHGAMVAGVPIGFAVETPPAPPRKQGRVDWLGFEQVCGENENQEVNPPGQTTCKTTFCVASARRPADPA
jgi:nitroreductase